MGVGGYHPASAVLVRENDPVRIAQEAGWTPGPVWISAGNLAPTGIRSPDRPTRSKSLHRLSYPGRQITYKESLIIWTVPTAHGVRGCGETAPIILKLGIRCRIVISFRLRPFAPGEMSPGRAALCAEKIPRKQVNRALGGPHSRSGRFRKDKRLDPEGNGSILHTNPT
jgi:hypothetical protein